MEKCPFLAIFFLFSGDLAEKLTSSGLVLVVVAVQAGGSGHQKIDVSIVKSNNAARH